MHCNKICSTNVIYMLQGVDVKAADLTMLHLELLNHEFGHVVSVTHGYKTVSPGSWKPSLKISTNNVFLRNSQIEGDSGWCIYQNKLLPRTNPRAAARPRASRQPTTSSRYKMRIPSYLRHTDQASPHNFNSN